MQNNSGDIAEQKSISKTFWQYAIPSIVAMLVSGLYQVIDGIFVGHYVGYEGLAGINITWPMIGLITGFGILVGMGAGSLLSIFRGEGNQKKVQQTFSSSLCLLVIFSLASMLIIHYLGTPMILAQGALNNTLSYSIDYLSVFTWGAGFTIAATALPVLIRNDNNPNLATKLMILGAVLNIALDYLFIAQLDWGLKGAAIATVIAQIIVVILGLLYFLSQKTTLVIQMSSANLASMVRIMNLGASGLFMFIYFSFILAVHNKLFLHYGSAVHVGAFAIVSYLGTMYYLLAEGIANGIQPPISYYYGAKQVKKITATLSLALKIIVISGVAVTISLNLFPETFIGLFNKADNKLYLETLTGMRLHLFAMVFDGFIFLSSVYFMSVDQGKKALAIAIGNIVIQLPFLYFLPLWLGLNGIWLAVPFSNIILTLIVAPMVWRDMREKHVK